MTICLAISTLAYGVYAATNLSFTVGANIAFTVDNLFVKVDAFAYNAYNQAGNTRLGTSQTLSNGLSVTALAEEVMDNSDGLSIIDDTDLEWDLTGQNLYFNSSDITEKMTFRIEVKNYSPNTALQVAIVPNQTTVQALQTAHITGADESGTGNVATAYDGTNAQTAVAIYTLCLTDLSTPIAQTQIGFTVQITERSNTVTLTLSGSSIEEFDGTLTTQSGYSQEINVVDNLTTLTYSVPRDEIITFTIVRARESSAAPINHLRIYTTSILTPLYDKDSLNSNYYAGNFNFTLSENTTMYLDISEVS